MPGQLAQCSFKCHNVLTLCQHMSEKLFCTLHSDIVTLHNPPSVYIGAIRAKKFSKSNPHPKNSLSTLDGSNGILQTEIINIMYDL